MGLFKGHDDDGSTTTTAAAAAQTCVHYLTIEPTDPIVGSYDFYHFNIILSGAATAFVAVVIFVLMLLHIRHLSKPREQLHILRLCLFMPVYAVGTLIMVVEPNAYAYLKPWLKFLEGVALAYFFLLIGQMISPEDASDSEVMLAPLIALAREKNVHPQSLVKSYRTGWLMVYQAPVVLLIISIITDIAQAVEGYCSEIGSPMGTVINSKIDTILNAISMASLLLAVLSVIKSSMKLKKVIRPYKGMLKLWAFKALILLQVLQEIIFMILERVSPSSIAPTKTLSYIDIQQGIPQLLTLLEMIFFVIFYHYAYSASPYVIGKGSKVGGYWPGGFSVWLEIIKVSQLINAFKFGFRIESEYDRLETSYQRGARRPFQRSSEESLVEPNGMPTESHNANAPPNYPSYPSYRMG